MHSQIPCSPFSFSSRARVAPSRGSPTKRIAFASACGPRNSGLDSHALHSETQQPQLMHSDSLCTAFIRSCEIRCSCSGAAPSSRRYGSTARNFAQNGSMSTTRSLITGRFPIGEITGTWPAAAMSYMRVLHASTAAPSIRIPQEPQIIIRQLLRYASVPSTVSLTMSRTSSSVAHSGASTS